MKRSKIPSLFMLKVDPFALSYSPTSFIVKFTDFQQRLTALYLPLKDLMVDTVLSSSVDFNDF